MASTITLLSVVNFAKTFVRSAPLVGAAGVANEPALSICNDTLQALLSSPYAWRFNKSIIPSFTTIPYQQDYVLSGCQMNIMNASGGQTATVHLNNVQSSNGPGLTETGTTVSALFNDFAPDGTAGLNGPPGSTPVTSGTSVPTIGSLVTITGANQGSYNVTKAVVTALITSPAGGIVGVKFTAAVSGLLNDGGQGIGGINWVTHATLEDYMSTATVRPVHDIEVVADLPKESIIQPPFKACFLAETNLPVIVPLVLIDSNGQEWLIGVTDGGELTSTAVSSTSGVPVTATVLIDVVTGLFVSLSILPSGELQTTVTATASTVNGITLQSPGGFLWVLEISNGQIATTVLTSGVVTAVTFRFWPVPSSQIWRAFLYYQAKAPLKTDLSQTWSPWPDDLGYVLRSGVKAKALDWFEDPRYPTAEIKWQQDILKALDVKDQEQRHEAFFPDLPLMRGG